MKNLRAAIQFLTLLPAGPPVEIEPRKLIPFFPVVGIIVGILLALFDQIVSYLWTAPITGVLDVFFLICVTGAFHIDGLGDAADGLLGHRPKERILEIMKDSRIGVMGLVAIVSVLAIKWAGITGIGPFKHKALFLIAIPAYSRAAMMFGFKFFEYGRGENGTGYAFYRERLQMSHLWGVGLPVLLSIFMGWKGLLLIGVFCVITTLILVYYRRRMGCITGDMFGALCEITESILFLSVSIGGG